MNNSILDILNDIKEKEFAFRDIYYDRVNDRITHVKGEDAFKSDVYGLIVGFLIYARYINLFDFRSVKDDIDIGVAIGKSSHPKKDKILALWNRLLNITEYPYYPHFLSLLADSKLSDYQSSENEETLAKWNNQHFIFACNNIELFKNYITSFEYKTIVECQSYLGIDLKHGNILVSVQEDECLEHLMENNPVEAHITFYKCSRPIQLEMSILMLQHYSNMEIIEDEEAEIFPFEDAQFDGVIIYRRQFNNEAFTLQLKDVLSFVKPCGFCIAFNQPREKVDEDFYKYQIPLMIDDLKNCVIICKKSDDRDESVPYAFAPIDDNRTASNEAFEKWTFAIKNCLFDRTYQQLSKDDFRYNAKIDFQSVCRKPGEENFVWRNFNDIISYKEYDKIGEWVFNTDFNKSQIVDSQILSDNPFQILADEGVYLKNYSNNNLEGEHPLDVCSISEMNGFYDYSIGERYIDIFKQTFNDEINNEKTEKFRTQLCCRIVTSPLILYSPFKKLIKINATPSRPVCIRLYNFIFEEMDKPYPELYCFKEIYKPIEINPAYDEQFIIYKLVKDVNHDHILIAPTREEQHTYFIYKQREYYSQYQKSVAETENDISRRIEQYSSRIYGAGFENFRRFKRLPLLPLSGVNIMVGANNAGKSTLVKGLLLALDNIKGLRVEHDDNIFSSGEQPLFRLDANNYHDVHIGTFNRAYSWQALQAEDKERQISFFLHIGKYVIKMSIKQVEHDDTSSIPISQIVISDERLGAKFDINYQTKQVKVYMNLSEEKIEYITQLSFSHDRVGATLIPQLIRGIAIDAEQKTAENFPEFGLIKGRMGFIYEIADELEAIINNSQVEYVYAHGISQKALFDYNDHNDYMAQTLHDLVNEKIGKSESDFIKYWFGVFGIGKDYDVQCIAGEYYNIKILNDNNYMVNLADLGMGSNQLITLILRLAIFIHRQRMRGNTPYTPMIIIEEPEQNMHPAFQSKLADLFKDIYINYGFCFIVETHSEYLVRRSQVIIAEQMFKDEDELKKNNPFKVYYFPADKNPYEMEYRVDGNFSNEFGKGFYDEASDLLFQIL